ncbi:MAG: glucose-1-phosphate cytidylyltransferase [Gemmatimonadaceae bacterium]|nr:glucose-1-phosphate cytidylyltransferase [Gemmatimonadaceae bacterium]
MKVVILAGGLGTRLREETAVRPKPMVEIGGLPILCHIMKIYQAHGFREFVLALGYKGEVIQDFFGRERGEEWTVHPVDTGQDVESGGRIRRLADWIGEETFMLTYGDGVADVDIPRLAAFHASHDSLATVTAVHPPSRFGRLELDGDLVRDFREKSQLDAGWINGGFFVLDPGVLDYISGDETIFEREPMTRLAQDGQLRAYRHEGFWQCMDTLRDVVSLEEQWAAGNAPWKIW